MYRKSSKGNPYHDSLGRFTSPGARGEGGKRGGDTSVQMWSSYGEQHTADSVLSKDKKGKLINDAKKWEKLDSERTGVARSDGRRHYHKQSINRETRARNVAHCIIPKGLGDKERQAYARKAKEVFEAENSVAIRNGGMVVAYRKGNSNEIRFQIVQSERMMAETLSNKSRATRNTATSMKQFSSYTVEFTKGNEHVRSCKMGASPKEVAKKIEAFCEKHKEIMSYKNVCIKMWRDKDGRVRFMPTYRFDTEAEAQEFAKIRGGNVINHDDGSVD